MDLDSVLIGGTLWFSSSTASHMSIFCITSYLGAFEKPHFEVPHLLSVADAHDRAREVSRGRTRDVLGSKTSRTKKALNVYKGSTLNNLRAK